MKTIAIDPSNVLVLPGWHGSGPDHWQSRWEALHGYRRVEQHSWVHPKRGDWSARLEEVLVDSTGPVVLVAHSLGCLLVAAWAAHSRLAADRTRVQAALLVAPPDIARDDVQALLPGWANTPLQRLPFPSLLVASRNDPYCTPERAQALADAWGAERTDTGEGGHLNSESGLGDWPAGHALLHTLLARANTTISTEPNLHQDT